MNDFLGFSNWSEVISPCFINKLAEGAVAASMLMCSSRLTPAGLLAMFTSNGHRDKTNERGHKPVKS